MTVDEKIFTNAKAMQQLMDAVSLHKKLSTLVIEMEKDFGKQNIMVAIAENEKREAKENLDRVVQEYKREARECGMLEECINRVIQQIEEA